MTVYWRPGCYFCSRLLRRLAAASVPVVLHNIWEDDDARAFVRTHNHGDETVPTVAFADGVWTNPDPTELIERVRSVRPDLVAAGPIGGPGVVERVQRFFTRTD